MRKHELAKNLYIAVNIAVLAEDLDQYDPTIAKEVLKNAKNKK